MYGCSGADINEDVTLKIKWKLNNHGTKSCTAYAGADDFEDSLTPLIPLGAEGQCNNIVDEWIRIY